MSTPIKSKWRRRLRNVALVVITLLLVLVFFIWRQHKPLPQGTEGPAAEALADSLLQAVNHTAWLNTGAVAWTFRGNHHFIWDRTRHLTEVRWGTTRVLLNINTQTGKAWENDVQLTGPQAASTIRMAYEYWANDSFWLNAPNKVRDAGTTRQLVTLNDGQKGLLVQYTSGGVTPGDAYLWVLDQNYRPVAWRMWVSIIPVGGLEFSWEQWKTLPTGAQVAAFHGGSLLDIPLTNIQGAKGLNELTGGADLFEPILE